MNPFEKYSKNPIPENTQQFEASDTSGMTLLFEQAIQRVEGVILQAPVPHEAKEKILSNLEDIQLDSEESLQQFFNEQSARWQKGKDFEERIAALWVYRKIKGAISTAESIIGRDGVARLEQAVEHLYTDPNEYTDKMHTAYMDSGKKPDNNY